MNKVSGLTFEKYANGNIRKVTFDYKKYSEVLKPVLKNICAIDEEDEFEKEWAKGGYTGEELKKEVKRRMRLWWK